VPVATGEQRFGFYELTRRHGDYAMAGVAFSASSVNPYSGLRIVFFGVGDHALRAPEAEVALEGQNYSETVIKSAKQALLSLPYNEDMNASETTKAHLTGVVLQRALESMQAESV